MSIGSMDIPLTVTAASTKAANLMSFTQCGNKTIVVLYKPLKMRGFRVQ